MKKFISGYLFLFMLLGCSVGVVEDKAQEIGLGTIKFGFNNIEATRAGLDDASKIIITVEDENGIKIYDRKVLNIIKFGTNLISEPVRLVSGNYKLTEFIVADSLNNAIYVTPLKGYIKAQLIGESFALPVNFTVTKNGTTNLIPKVISTSTIDISVFQDFGYSSFKFDVVETFNFLIAPFLFDENANMIFTDAVLTIRANDVSGDILLNTPVSPEINVIEINDGYDNYHINLTKDFHGNIYSFSAVYNSATLKSFINTPLDTLLMGEPLSDDAKLSSIITNPNIFGTSSFDPLKNTYSYTVNWSRENISINPTTSESNSTVKINGVLIESGTSRSVPLNFGLNTIEIDVTAQISTITRKYILKITRPNPPIPTVEITDVSFSGSFLPNSYYSNETFYGYCRGDGTPGIIKYKINFTDVSNSYTFDVFDQSGHTVTSSSNGTYTWNSITDPKGRIFKNFHTIRIWSGNVLVKSIILENNNR